MNPGLFKIVAAAMALLIAAGVAITLLRREPAWEGKSLGAWLEEFDRNQNAAANAVRAMGTNTLPHLIDELRAEDSAWTLRLAALAKRQRLVHFDFTPDVKRRQRAIQAVRALGPSGRPAIPALGEALALGSSGALPVLESFGPEAIPALSSALTNSPGCGAPYATALALGRMGANARGAVTNLVWEFEHYSVGYPRGASAKAAAEICLQLIQRGEPSAPEVRHAKAALLRGLSSTNALVQGYAANALAILKHHAQESAPLLAPLLRHTSAPVRTSATNALRAVTATP
jgi:hypothetical protein